MWLLLNLGGVVTILSVYQLLDGYQEFFNDRSVKVVVTDGLIANIRQEDKDVFGRIVGTRNEIASNDSRKEAWPPTASRSMMEKKSTARSLELGIGATDEGTKQSNRRL